jgi:hypothetical protein
MSCDFAVWFPHERLSDHEAGEVFGCLRTGDTSNVRPHSAVSAFYAELTSKHPEINDVPLERLGDSAYSPWSGPIDHSPAHVLIECVWSQAHFVFKCVHDLARKHGLAVFDPQSNHVAYPSDLPVEKPAWPQDW